MHPNEKLIRAGFESFVSGDFTAMSDFFDDAIVLHVGGSSVLAGRYEGKAATLAWFARVAELTEGTVRLDIRDVLANDEHAIVLTTTRAKLGDRTLDEHGVVVFELRDEKVTQAWMFSDDQEKIDSFFA